jgi:hypothetical protein
MKEGYFVPLEGITHVVAENLFKLHAIGNAGACGIIRKRKNQLRFNF